MEMINVKMCVFVPSWLYWVFDEAHKSPYNKLIIQQCPGGKNTVKIRNKNISVEGEGIEISRANEINSDHVAVKKAASQMTAQNPAHTPHYCIT